VTADGRVAALEEFLARRGGPLLRINTNLTVTLGHGQTTHMVGTRDVSWLPPTSANLADLRVPIPAGFTQVSHR
jgi:hypothetical protein